ncbi:MAG TPA: hypothetical protein DEP19_09610 [Anaerolineae bacterium]|nr:hypothetical protein [Anaerolineae bacterium]HCK64867.1 hypothetical protein [Anaerolineae bacterium]
MKTIFSNSKYKMYKWILFFSFMLLVIATAFFLSYKTTDVGASPSMIVRENISFKNDVQPILERRCTKCHGGEFPSESLNLESYESLMVGSQNGEVVIAGDSSNSLLFEQIESGEMPKRGSDLTAEQIELIRQWINEGALNN